MCHLRNTSRTWVHGLGKVAKALCSTSSMSRLATVTDTGEPIAVPWICLAVQLPKRLVL